MVCPRKSLHWVTGFSNPQGPEIPPHQRKRKSESFMATGDVFDIELARVSEKGTMRFVLGEEVAQPNFAGMSFLPDRLMDLELRGDEVVAVVLVSSKEYRRFVFEKWKPVQDWSISKSGQDRYMGTYEEYQVVSIKMTRTTPDGRNVTYPRL